MRVNTALWVATVALFLTVGSSGKCFAGSSIAGEPKDESTAVTSATPSEPAVAGVVPRSMDQVDVQLDTAEGDAGGSARSEAAEPTNKRPGQRSSSKVGIGLKISTLGAGIEAALPVFAKVNLRGGLNIFQYDRTFTNDGIHYTGQLHFRSGEAHFDWYPFGGYQGSARVALNLAGNVCDSTGTFCRSVSSDSTVQANVLAQQQKIRNDVNPYRFFPVVSLGVGF